MTLTDAADIIGIPPRPVQSELSRAADIAAIAAQTHLKGSIDSALRMAFFDGVQYGLRMAREAGRDER